MKLLFPVALILPLCLAPVGDADAITRQDIQNATGNCQAALPVFDGQIRKRPLALGNEGDAPAFVTCSLMGDYSAPDNSMLVLAVVRNFGAKASTIHCTLVAGRELNGAPPPLYIPKSQEVSSGSEHVFNWNPANDNGGAPIRGPLNLSCLLPPETVINLTLRAYDENIGA